MCCVGVQIDCMSLVPMAVKNERKIYFQFASQIGISSRAFVYNRPAQHAIDLFGRHVFKV